ncbi:hypothetical protein HLVA_22190 (plasmid) [Haliovirga abyssi]|uniref:ABC transmembrane type-1 domain-containing protein n=2 Tax=Haliovirga abyssi TaxID=2996794 RepID=A0AAU9E128_9FUSO|nr:hypothetical protein HLVA_22190 [Haliovirga abyssi]
MFYSLNNISPRFIGFGNYIKMFKDPAISKSIINTLIFMLASVFVQVGIGVLLAMLVDMIRAGQNFFKTVYLFPVVVSAAALGLMFNLFYGYDGGLLNSFLAIFGIGKVVWLTEKTSLLMVIIPTVWQYVGFYFVIILTAITKIPTTFYEAAHLEGANAYHRITKITLPLIFGDIKVSIMLAITGTLKVFDFVWIITQGGPFDSSQVLGTYMYDITFQRRLFGYGSSIAVLIVVLGFALTFFTNKFLKSEDITY